MKNEQTAIDKADSMILDLLKTQPELLKPSTSGATGGKEIGDFIAALRDRLTGMYQQKS